MRSVRSKIAILVLLLLAVSVGYAFLSTTLKISGTAKVKSNTWNVYFGNINVKEGSVVADEPSLSLNDTKLAFDVQLNEPGDKYEFTLDAVNGGTIDAMIESVTKTNLTSTEAQYVNLVIAYEDGVEIQAKDLLAATKTEKILVSIEYKKNLSEEDLPQSDIPINVSLEIEYVQADNTAKEIQHKKWKAVTGDGTNVGDEIAIGDEHFYVISNDGTTINALAKYNLNAGNNCTTYDSCTPIENPTYKQDEAMTGYKNGTYGHGSLAFSNTNGWPYSNNATIDIQAYDGPVKTAINAYKEILPEGVEVRLITKAEIEVLVNDGATLSSGSIKDKADAKGVSWVYSTSYWSGSARASSDDRYVWYVHSDGRFFSGVFFVDYGYGVRPVISLES